MASWPTGIETIKALIAAGNLQKVAPSLKSAQGFLAQAAGHLDSAQSVSETDPTGAYSLLYDAARKSLAAVLHVQGLRATSKGGHYAIQEAISAQLPSRRRVTHSAPSGACGAPATRLSTTT